MGLSVISGDGILIFYAYGRRGHTILLREYIRHKQCFMMYHVDGMSEYDIARELNVGRSTVQKFLERAKQKIEYAKVSSLFLLE
jgi:predicted DNA-binding protein YlxM (UPF0122 family)